MPFTEEKIEELGTEIAKLVNLKLDKKTKMYDTQWGTKSAVGLGRCILRLIEEAESKSNANYE